MGSVSALAKPNADLGIICGRPTSDRKEGQGAQPTTPGMDCLAKVDIDTPIIAKKKVWHISYFRVQSHNLELFGAFSSI
jgi:hypothetical protein